MTKDKQKPLEIAKARFQKAKEYFSTEYERGRDDVDFLFNLDGAQWPEKIKNLRLADNRPCLTENRLLAFVHQLVNDIRQSRPSIKVSPVDSGADVETASVLRGMVRNIENISCADNVYDTAAENAIQSGYGWIRVHIDYADDATFTQEIQLKRIRNPFSVFFDPDSMEMDGSDAEYCFIFDDLDRDEFKEKYPDASEVPFDDYHDSGWATQDKVRIAEYFYKEYQTKTIVLGEDGNVYEAGQYNGKYLQTRTISVPVVKWCKLTGVEVLEETTWPGKYIPIVPVYGEEAWIDGKRMSFSLIHQAKDPQMRFNFMLTADTETLALQPKAPYVGLRGQFKTMAQRWATASTKNPAFLEYDPVELPDGNLYIVPPQRSAPPQTSAGFFNHMMAAGDGIKNTLGIFNASLGQEGNEKSGRAILARQAEGDNATFHFIDNLATAIRQAGMIIIDLIPKVYSDQRIVRILGEDGSEEAVPINQPFYEKDGAKMPVENPLQQPASGIHDLSAGKYDVMVSVGPSYATKRQETANFILETAKAFPQIIEVGGDVFFENLDSPGSDIIAERLKKLLPPALKDDAEDGQLMQAQQAIQALEMQIQQMDAALKDKTMSEEIKREIELKKLDLEQQKITLEAAKTQAQIETQIPAQAMNDVAGAIADLQGQVADISSALEMTMTALEEQPVSSEQARGEESQKGFFSSFFGR